MAGLSLDVGDAGRVVRHVGEDKSLFVVILAEDLVLAQVEAVAHAEPATRHVCCHHEQNAQTHYGADPPLYTIDTEYSFSGDKTAGMWIKRLMSM